METSQGMRCAGLFLAFFIAHATAQSRLVARVDMLGIRGPVTFLQNAPQQSAAVSFRLSGVPFGSTFLWSIRSLYVNYDQAERCTDAAIGPGIFGSSEALGTVTSSDQTQTVNGIALSGEASIAGATLLLQDSTFPARRACATILPITTMVTAHATFPLSIAGDVNFRQSSDLPNSDTIIYTDLFFVDGQSLSDSLFWEIFAEPVDENSINGRCDALRTIYNPNSASSFECGRAIHSNCIIGDLTSKLGNVAVTVRKGLNRQRYIDSNLPLAGSNSIIGKTLAIMTTDNEVLACATIRHLTERTVRVNMNNDGVEGYLEFNQQSPFDSTKVSISLQNLQRFANGFDVHEFPVPTKLSTTDAVCSAAAVGGHFNPFGINTVNSPADGIGTNDQYEVGDLSGKYGNLRQKRLENAVYTDWNLPLFGRNSIIGRSVVIHRNDIGGTRWICANILYNQEVELTSAIVRFTYPVIGFILFQQIANESWSETSIHGELDYVDGSGSTFNHNWYVHVNQVGDDFRAAIEQRCQSAQGHYNPLRVNLNDPYDVECSGQSMLRCELGDLSGKHGQIGIRSGENIGRKFYFTDINLPMAGSRSIIGRSIVIHNRDSGAQRLVCANIYKKYPVSVEVKSWSDNLISATVGVAQETSFDPAHVTLLFSSLSGLAGDYSIHDFPLPSNSFNPCSDEYIGGEYNPFNVHLGRGTYDGFAIGDLSGKYEPLSGQNELTVNAEDNTVSLMGPLSIVGRSVVIYKDLDGSKLMCGNITHKLPDDTTWVQRARADFNQRGITGTIYLSQIQYSDGSYGDTQVYIDVSYVDNSTQTVNHNWHTHEFPVSTTDVGCASAGVHYNPFNANTGSGYAECGFGNPWRCELGDQSGKLSRYDIGGGRNVHNDVNLPLTGQFSVIGRSFVVHEQDGGSPRLVCANILPADAPFRDMQFLDPQPLNQMDFSQVISRALNAERWMVSVEVSTKRTSDPGCLDVDVFFAGSQASSLRARLNSLILRNDAFLGRYRPSPDCSTSTTIDPVITPSTGITASASLLLLLPVQAIMAGYLYLQI